LSDIRADPAQAAIQEKLGVFNMQEEQDRISAMMQQLHGPDQPQQQMMQQKPSMTAADKKRNRKKK